MVGMTGLEPAALWSQTRCATKLRYIPMLIYYTLFPLILQEVFSFLNDRNIVQLLLTVSSYSAMLKV